jgi:acetyltransferase-like isoleucine patch superfamily enzyme
MPFFPGADEFLPANEGSDLDMKAQNLRHGYSEDPLLLVPDLRTKAKTTWMRLTYPFAAFGKGVSIHHTCDLRRPVADRIRIGDNVYIGQDAWLNVPWGVAGAAPVIVIGNGCKIGRRCMLSAKNLIQLEEDVLFGPSVLITDHSHGFSDIDAPIHMQALTSGGTLRIERNCWLSYGAAVICTSGELVIGRNSVIGANAVVTRSVPPYSVVAGNPARVVRRFDSETRKWIKTSENWSHCSDTR